MRKLQKKYKWQKRESHFLDLKFKRAMWASAQKSYAAMNKLFFNRWQEDKKFTGLMHWTDEELEKIKESTCLANESALDGVADTTNSALKESRHSLDEFGGWFADQIQD